MPTVSTIKLIGIAIILGLFGYLVYDRQALKTDIADQQTTIVQLQDANSNFAADAKRSNDAIAAEVKVREEQKVQYEAALKAADLREVASKKQQLAIMNEKVTGDHCLFAHTLFTGYMKGRHP